MFYYCYLKLWYTADKHWLLNSRVILLVCLSVMNSRRERLPYYKAPEKWYNQFANITTQDSVNLRVSVSLTTLKLYVQKEVAERKIALIDILGNVDIKINAEEEVPVSILMLIYQTLMKRVQLKNLTFLKLKLKAYRGYKCSESWQWGQNEYLI